MAKKGLKYEVIENKMLNGENSYCARTYVNGTYDTNMLIERMSAKGTHNEAECHGFFKDLSDSSREILSEGNSICIPRLLKLSPVVKGTFDGQDDGYQEGRNYIDINATVAKAFVKKVEDKIEVNKIAKPDARAKIKSIQNARTEQNEICKHFSNIIKGNFFIFSGFEFKGIELRNCLNPEEKVFIEDEALNYPEFSNVGFSFTILYNLELPGWLTDGLDIFLRLVYKAENDSATNFIKGDHYSEDFKTKWKEL